MFSACTRSRSINSVYGSCFGGNILITLPWFDPFDGGSSIIGGVAKVFGVRVPSERYSLSKI